MGDVLLTDGPWAAGTAAELASASWKSSQSSSAAGKLLKELATALLARGGAWKLLKSIGALLYMPCVGQVVGEASTLLGDATGWRSGWYGEDGSGRGEDGEGVAGIGRAGSCMGGRLMSSSGPMGTRRCASVSRKPDSSWMPYDGGWYTTSIDTICNETHNQGITTS